MQTFQDHLWSLCGSAFLNFAGLRHFRSFRITQTHHLRHDNDKDPMHGRRKKPPRPRSRAPPRAWHVWAVGMAGLWCSSRARSFVWCVSPRGAGAFKTQATAQRRGGMCLGMWDAPRGTGSVFTRPMIVLDVPRRLRWPSRAGSTRNANNNS